MVLDLLDKHDPSDLYIASVSQTYIGSIRPTRFNEITYLDSIRRR